MMPGVDALMSRAWTRSTASSWLSSLLTDVAP